MLLQPFVNYNFGHGWAVTSSPLVTADWKASSANKWTVPISGRPEQAVQSGAAADQHIGAGLLQRGEAPVRRGLAAALPGPAPPSQPQVGPLSCDLGPMPVRSPSSLHCPVEGVT